MVVGDRADDRQRTLYDLVHAAQLRARTGIRAGMAGCEADALARDLIEARGFGEAFGHSLGHGLGLEVHEAPRLSKTNPEPLAGGRRGHDRAGRLRPRAGRRADRRRCVPGQRRSGAAVQWAHGIDGAGLGRIDGRLPWVVYYQRLRARTPLFTSQGDDSRGALHKPPEGLRMNLDIIARLVQILRDAPELGAIEVRRGLFGAWSAVRVSRAGHASSAGDHVVVAHAPPRPRPRSTPVTERGTGRAEATPGGAGGGATPPVAAPALLEIKSPMVGTFYGAPEPGAEPYVKVGSRVATGPGRLHHRSDEDHERNRVRDPGVIEEVCLDRRAARGVRPDPLPSGPAWLSAAAGRPVQLQAGHHADGAAQRLRPAAQGRPAGDHPRERAISCGLETQPLKPEELKSLAEQIMTPRQVKEFAEHKEADFAIGVPGRRPVPHQRLPAARHAWRSRSARFPTRSSRSRTCDLPPVLEEIAARPRGLVLVTGVTGSGKSTALAAMINHINSTRRVNIITIEDPIEFLHRDKLANISQREVGNDTLSFNSALRHVLRQDPDVILIGEIRDMDTLDTALKAADTGHLVFSTLHTTDATQTINRVISFFPPHQHEEIRHLLSTALQAVVSLRLVPRKDGRGRVPAAEVLINTAAVQDNIRDVKKQLSIPDLIAEGSIQYGMQSFDQSLFQWFQQGVISYESAVFYATNPSEFALKVSGVDSAASKAFGGSSGGAAGRIATDLTP